MTYTVAYREFHAPTLAEAAEAMLRDPEIWHIGHVEATPSGSRPEAVSGDQQGYALDHWVWYPERHMLVAWFR